jgi:ribulose-phosphate 3-epimerase
MSIQIIPSLLEDSKEKLSQQLQAIEDEVSMAQIDLADGEFVSNTTCNDPEFIAKQTDLDLELHLMVEEPNHEIEKWGNLLQLKRILFHYESTENPEEIIKHIHKTGCHAGIVLNPDTEIDVVENFIDSLEDVMFMGVEPGFQGQELIPEVLDKMNAFKDKYPETYTQIDGSVNEETLEEIITTGVNAVCPGSAIFAESDPAENIKSMKKIIHQLEN